MDPPLDPPLRMSFMHPGRTLTTAEAQGNVANFLSSRAERMSPGEGGGAVESDGISSMLGKLNEALKDGANREMTRSQGFDN